MPDFYPTYKQRIYYQEINSVADKTVLLLHGLGVNSASWQLQSEALARVGFRTIIPDLPGFGRSIKGRTSSIAHVASLNAALIKSIGKKKVSIVGISMGGAVALQMALDFPDIIDHLVLISAFDRLRPGKFSEWVFFIKRAYMVLTSGVSYQAQFVATRLFPDDDQEMLRNIFIEQVKQADPGVYRSTMMALMRFNASHRLKDVQLPTLVITGESDTVVSPNVQRRLLRIPGAKQVIIPSAGHAVIADNPDFVNKIMIEFLSNEDDNNHA